MVDYLFPATPLIDSATEITDSVPTVGNVVILADSTCTAGRAAVNFYCSPNPISKVCFVASCLFGVAGAASSDTALATSFLGISLTGLVGSFGARAFNRLGKLSIPCIWEMLLSVRLQIPNILLN